MPEADGSHPEPGAVVGVQVGGEQTFLCRGYGSVEHHRPNTPDTSFMVGSIAKQFLGATALEAASRNRLSLSHRVGNRLGIGLLRETELHHLLNHASGLRETEPMFALAGIREHDYLSRSDHLEAMGLQSKLMFSSGSAFSYANINYLVAAVAMEDVLSQPLPELCRALVLDDEGLNHTRFMANPDDVIQHRAESYEATGERLSRAFRSCPSIGPSGLWSTARDLLRWGQVRRRRFVGAPSFALSKIESSSMGGWPTAQAGKYVCGLVEMSGGGGIALGHAGDDQGYSSQLLSLPSETQIVALSNSTRIRAAELVAAIATLGRLRSTRSIDDWRGIIEESFDGFLREEAAPQPSRPDVASIQDDAPPFREGRYVSDEALAPITIEVTDNHLVLWRGGHRDALTPRRDNCWEGPGYTVSWDRRNSAVLRMALRRAGKLEFSLAAT